MPFFMAGRKAGLKQPIVYALSFSKQIFALYSLLINDILCQIIVGKGCNIEYRFKCLKIRLKALLLHKSEWCNLRVLILYLSFVPRLSPRIARALMK